MRIIPTQFVPSLPTFAFNEGKMSARIENLFSSHVPKFSASTRHYTYIFLGGVLLLGFSLAAYRYLKPTFKKISLVWRMYQIYRRAQNRDSSSVSIDDF